MSMGAILLEANGMIIREDTRFWIYVITSNQWTRLNQNLENNILYCSTYTMYGVRRNDIIAIYKKDPKKGGFMGIAQVYSDMHNNTKKISIYGDHHMDNNLVEFEQITLLTIPIKISKIPCFAKTIYKKYQSFSSKMLQGDCSLREIDKKSGFIIIDHLIKTISFDLPTTQTTPNETQQVIDSKIEANGDELIGTTTFDLPTTQTTPNETQQVIDSKIEANGDELIGTTTFDLTTTQTTPNETQQVIDSKIEANGDELIGTTTDDMPTTQTTPNETQQVIDSKMEANDNELIGTTTDDMQTTQTTPNETQQAIDSKIEAIMNELIGTTTEDLPTTPNETQQVIDSKIEAIMNELIGTTTDDPPTTPNETHQVIDSKIEANGDELICCKSIGDELIDSNESSQSSDCESDEDMKNIESLRTRRIEKYIPVMLCGCKLIQRGVKKIIQNKGSRKSFNRNDFFVLMMRHYDDCDECEFTNNNDGDIGRIIRSISLDRVHLYFDHTATDDAIDDMMRKTFDSYLLAEPYSSSEDNHMNIYLIDEHEYKGAIVFEWMGTGLALAGS